MKHHRLLAAVAVIILLASASTSSLAQATLPDTARIAFVNADRCSLYAKKLGSTRVDTLLKAIGTYGLPGSFRPSHIAVLASSADGNSLLIGLRLAYYNARVSQMDSFECFARLDSAFDLKGAFLTVGPPMSFGSKTHPVLTVLKVYNTNTLTPQKPLPLGTLTNDGKEWFATWRKTSTGDSVQFFHGNFDASGKVDSVTLRGSDAPISGFQMTNFIVSPDNKTMLMGLTENVQQTDAVKMYIIRWEPSASGGSNALQTSNITGIVAGFSSNKYWNIDSIFGFSMRMLPGSTDHAELGLFVSKTRTINFYQFPIYNGITNLTPDGSFSIPASAVPDKNQLILSGFHINSYSIEDSEEVISAADGGPYGNGGDIMFSSTWDSVIFVTCASDQSVTPGASAIYLYDQNANKTYLVHNNVNEIERQPILMGSVKKLAPPPPYVKGIGVLSKTALDFGTVFTDSTTAKTGTILSDTKSGKIIVHTMTFSGSGASAFSLVSPPTLPLTILGGGTLNIPISFKPTAVQSYDAVLTITYRDSTNDATGPDSVLTATLHGVGAKRPDTTGSGSVRLEAEANFLMTLIPNPMTTGTVVDVTAKSAGVVRVELVDINGHSIFHSDARMLGQGERTSFQIDAKSLGLAAGSYYVVLHTPLGDVMRKAIVIE